MKNIGILCGGANAEHEVSLLSAWNVHSFIDRSLYNPYLFGINKLGRLIYHQNLILQEQDVKKVHLNPQAIEVSLSQGAIHNIQLDAVFPLVHGENGEDGCLQGLLKFFHIPYVGSEIKSSAIGMDKEFTKILCQHFNIPVVPFLTWKAGERRPLYQETSNLLGDNLVIKPTNNGSSVGVSLCSNEADFEAGLELAKKFDSKVLIEKAIIGKELEVAVLQVDQEILTSQPAQIIAPSNFYSYEEKYTATSSTKAEIPANLSLKEESEIRVLAAQIFKILEMKSLARVDFFLDDSGNFYLNEINSLPGFTAISMYPKLFLHAGLEYPQLIHLLIKGVC